VHGCLDLGEHQVDPDLAEALLRLRVGQVKYAGLALRDGGRDVADVGARVAVLRCRIAFGRGEKRARKTVDLGAVVVEVVLAGDLGATELQNPGQRVADRGPVGFAETNSRLIRWPDSASPRP